MSFTVETVAKFPDLYSEIVDVDPDLAKHLRATCHFERQRPITPRNVERLAREMRGGNFVKATPIFMCILPDNSMVIVNGNHTLEAVAGGVITMPLTFIYHRVNNMEEAAKIYVTMDIHKTRSWNVTLEAMGMKERIAMANKVMPGVRIIMDSFNSYVTSQGETSRLNIMEKMEEYADVALRLNTFWDDTPKRLQNYLSRAAFISVALITTQHQPTMAEEFWGGAARDDGLNRNDPRKQLLNYAMTHKSASSASRVIDLNAAVLCWNAFFENRTMEILRPSQLKEIYILGTNWHKGKPVEKPVAEKKAVVEKKAGKRASKIETGQKLTKAGIVPVSGYTG